MPETTPTPTPSPLRPSTLLPPEQQEDVALEHLQLLDEITTPAKPDTANLEAHTRSLKDLAHH